MKLLESHPYNDTEWIGSDTKELYQNNLKTQSDDWPWRNQKITYTVNSQRYRAPEWQLVDWNNSILMFGCSQIFGLGVDDNQTVCSQLARMLKINVINLGMPGGSCMGQWINTEKLLNYNVTPLAVVYNWPDASRIIELINDTKNRAGGSWILDSIPKRFSNDWITHPTQGLEYAKYAITSVKRSWQCPQLHYSWDNKLSIFLKSSTLLTRLDTARDNLHAGPRTLEQWAKILAKNLLLKIKI